MSWFKFQAKAEDPAAVDVLLYDVVGDWIDEMWGGFDGVKTAKAFVAELSALPENVKTIRVRINSPGGDVFGAATIANALRDQQMSKGRKVETYVDGLAASAASVIAMAGSKVTMADNALMMVHNPWTYAVGNPAEIRKAADTLDAVRDTIIATYQWHSPLDAKAIGKLMDEETWMSADEAIARGFAEAKVDGLSAAASIDPRGAARVISIPEQYAARVSAWFKSPEVEAPAAEVVAEPEVEVPEVEAPAVEVEPEPVAEVAPAPKDAAVLTVKLDVDASALEEALAKMQPGRIEPVVEAEPLADAAEIVSACAAHQLSVEFITAVVAASPTREGLAARVAAEVDRVAKDSTRAEAIRAMYGKYNMGKIGETIAAAGLSVDEAGKVLTEIKAQRDSVMIDGTLPTTPSKQNVLSYTETYARLNGVAKLKE